MVKSIAIVLNILLMLLCIGFFIRHGSPQGLMLWSSAILLFVAPLANIYCILRSIMLQEISEELRSDIITEYLTCTGDFEWMVSFCDAKTLPFSKRIILNAIVSEYKSNANKKKREVLKDILLSLTHFQDGIGETPVKSELYLFKPDSEQIHSSFKTYVEANKGIDEKKYKFLSKQAETEYQSYLKLLKF